MARGFLSGAVWGLLAATGSAVALSVVVPLSPVVPEAREDSVPEAREDSVPEAREGLVPEAREGSVPEAQLSNAPEAVSGSTAGSAMVAPEADSLPLVDSAKDAAALAPLDPPMTGVSPAPMPMPDPEETVESVIALPDDTPTEPVIAEAPESVLSGPVLSGPVPAEPAQADPVQAEQIQPQETAGASQASVPEPDIVSTTPETMILEVPAGTPFDPVRRDEAVELPAASDPSPSLTAAAPVSAPSPDDLTPLAGAVTTPTEAPRTGGAQAALSDPAAQTEAAALSATRPSAGERRVLPNPQAAAPIQPLADAELSISTTPAQPPAPQVSEAASGLEADPADIPLTAGASGPADASRPDVVVALPESETAQPQVAQPDVALAQTDFPQVGIPDSPEPAPQTPAATQETPTQATPTQAPTTLAPTTLGEVPAASQGTVRLPQITSEPQSARPVADEADPAPAQTRAPAPESGVSVNRLPTVSTAPAEQATSEAEIADNIAQSPGADAPDPDAPPLIRFASPYQPGGDNPQMSIILMDDGTGPLGASALEGFPFPLTFAVDANRADAAEIAAAYRAEGFEVMALANLPEGAAPVDVEVAMQAWFGAVPEAVAVMEGDGFGLQASRAVSDQVTQIIASSGHGLVMRPKGLNTAQQLAAREGVPSATIFRDFDSEGQDPRVIRRFLDHAAFKARQEGAVIMLGRLRPDTVSALLLWGLQDRAESVDLVPVSVVLRGGAGEPGG